MANGIIIFGANGCGKTTIGREIAKKMNFKHLDVEDYYFDKTDILYQNPREKYEVIKLMLNDINKCESFVLSSVMGHYGDEIISMYKLAVFLSAPIDLRIERIRKRAIDKHGEIALEDGEIKKNREEFIDFVRARDLSKIDEWAITLTCPIIMIDATKPVDDIVREIETAYFSLNLLKQ